MFGRKSNSWALALVVAALPLSGMGCSDDDDSPTDPVMKDAYVRVAHLSPDAPMVDVWLDGAVVIQDVAFEDFSGYLSISEGEHRIQVSPANQTSPIVIDATVDLVEGKSYTVAAMGNLVSIAPVVLVDDRAANATKAKVRFIHASPDAPAVDVTLTDGSILFPDVSFRGSSAVQSVSAGSYDLQVRVAGTETVALSFGDVALSNGTYYSVFATGSLADGSIRAVVAVDVPGSGGATVALDPATSSVRVAHLSPDAPPVDVYLDGKLVSGLSSVPYKAISGYLSVGSTTHNVKVYAENTMSDPVIDADVTLIPGSAYTIAATGLVGTGDLSSVILVDDRSGTTPGSSLVRFVHFSPDAPHVDIKVENGPTLFDNVGFRGFAGYEGVSAGSYDLEVRLEMGGDLALAVPGVDLLGGASYTVFAVGLAGSSTLEAILVKDTP